MNITFDIQTWWRAGSAFGDGAVSDATVHRDGLGLPFVPGRTLKGLCRHALQLAIDAEFAVAGQRLTKENLVAWFGPELRDLAGADRDADVAAFRYQTSPGALRFESARLPTAWRLWAEANPGATWALVTQMATTAVDPSGVAADHTLRTVEVAAPMVLSAEVVWHGAGKEDARWKIAFREALPVFVRGVGSTRNRGFGRVAVRVDDAKGGAA